MPRNPQHLIQPASKCGAQGGGRTGSQLALGPQRTTPATLTGAEVLDTPCGTLGVFSSQLQAGAHPAGGNLSVPLRFLVCCENVTASHFSPDRKSVV